MITLYSISPESRAYGANHLATCIGPGMRFEDGTLADLRTFVSATHERDGVRYIAVDARITEEKGGQIAYLVAHPELLQRPAFDTGNEIDMGAAADELAATVVLVEASDEALPAPTGLVISTSVDLVAAYGLTISVEE